MKHIFVAFGFFLTANLVFAGQVAIPKNFKPIHEKVFGADAVPPEPPKETKAIQSTCRSTEGRTFTQSDADFGSCSAGSTTRASAMGYEAQKQTGFSTVH